MDNNNEEFIKKVILLFVTALITGVGFLMKKSWDYLDQQPRISACSTYNYGEFKLLDNANDSYESQKSESEKVYSHAIENRVWIENPGDGGIKVTKGTLKVNSISGLEEDSLQLIIGITGNELSIYVVNNTFTDLGRQYFEMSPFEFDNYHLLTDQEMISLFQVKAPIAYVDSLPSGSIFKLYEFKIKDSAKNILLNKNVNPSEVTAHNLLQIRHYTEKNSPMPEKNDPEYNDQIFCPFAIYYYNDRLEYAYYSQSHQTELENGSNTIPTVFIDTEKDEKEEFEINVDNYIPSKDTKTLVQYIVPNRSCKINYSVALEINGKKLNSELTKNTEVKIKVPVYSIDEGIRERNEEAYNILKNNNIEESFYDSQNAFVETFKYDPEKWVENSSN